MFLVLLLFGSSDPFINSIYEENNVKFLINQPYQKRLKSYFSRMNTSLKNV